MMYVPPILRLEHMKYVYLKICVTAACSQSKQAIMKASDYIETAYHDARVFMQLTQCCVFMQHFDDI